MPRHDDEVHQRRRVGRAAGAGAADHRDLRHDAGEQHIRVEHLAIAGKRVHALLDARAAGILEGHHRHADAQRVVHQARDLVGVHLAERAGDDAEILAEGRHLHIAGIAGAGDHAVGRQRPPGHAEMRGLVGGMKAEFLEAALDEQRGETLARREQALGVQRRQLFLAGALPECGAPGA